MDTYAYLGSMINKDGDCEKEIRSGLAKVYAITTHLKSTWQIHGIANTIKVKLLRALVWTLRKHDETNIRAFEMKCLKYVLRISWTGKRTSEWVLNKVGT